VRRELLGEGVSAGGVAVSWNHLPNPLPPRVRRHSSTAQTPAKRVRRSTEHARGSRGWQCRLRGTPRPSGRGRHPAAGRGGHPPATEWHHRVTTPQGGHRIASPHRSGERRRARTAPATDRARHHRRPVRDRHGRPRGVRPPVRTGRPRGVRHIHRRCTRPHPRPRGSTPPPAAPCSAGPNAWPPTGPRERTGAVARRGRTPVERLNPAQVTVYFQPTSHPCRFLGELADQPPCYQARRDHAVRFHPTGTGH
jgi:hypothetical protein